MASADMAVPIHNSTSGSLAAASIAVSSTSKKQGHLAEAGRRKLEEFRKKKAEEKRNKPVPNLSVEDRVLETDEIPSNQSRNNVFVNGLGANIQGAIVHPQDTDFLNSSVNGSSAGRHELPESELRWEMSNGDSSEKVKESHHFLSEQGGSNFVKVSKSDSVERLPYTDESTTVVERKDVTGLLSDFPLLNGVDDISQKRPSACPSSTLASDKISSAFVVPREKSGGALTSLGMPAFSSIHLSKDEDAFSPSPFREERGPGQANSRLDFYPNSNDMTHRIMGPSAEKPFSFVPSRALSPLNFEEIRANFLSRPPESSPFVSSFVPTSSSIPIPIHPSTVATSGITFTVSKATSEKESVLPLDHDYLSAKKLDDVSVAGHDMRIPNWSNEIQRHSERDEFATLEQHIEDLTQEKFSLQRALDAARVLAESLAQENSALTEDFNSQGALVNQLQADLRRQEEEINAQSLVLSSFMVEREKAQQESNSAIERSQILAGEVIGLEEKVLKLRSNELKLERDLESLKSDNDSCRAHLATLEKDRQNLRSVVEALQEEKKLLQGQFQKKLVSGNSITNTKAVAKESRDVSTSTDDLEELQGRTQKEQVSLERKRSSDLFPERMDNRFEAASSSTSTSFNKTTLPFNLAGLNMLPAHATVPADHLQTVNNIDSLITELATEKENLLKALKKESSKAADLEALNADLSKKLELQTQHLELVFAQNMAHGGVAMGTNSNDEHQDNEFVDEGDEVVERVLGWIMRLFPSGSSKRRTSKLL